MIIHSIRAPVDWGASQGPWAYCDLCNFRYLHRDLSWQHQWNGAQLVNQRILVCPRCLDVPQEQLRAIFIGPDPYPVKDARPGFTYGQQIDYRATQTGDERITQGGDPRIIETGNRGEDDAPASEILDIP